MTTVPESNDPLVRGTSSRNRRSELSTFLRSRRARVAPGDVGLPVGSRRRTPGLRREEVAQLSGIGVTWYTWLEQGRPINASMQVLEAIARTLRLDAAERAHLCHLADMPIDSGAPPSQLPEALPTILGRLDPLPAAVLSTKYDILAHNDAYRALYPGFMGADCNVLRQVILTPECCNPYRNTPIELGRMVAYLRGVYVKNLDDQVWRDFVTELHASSPKFAELWERNDVAAPGHLTKLVRSFAVGELSMSLTSMQLPSVAGAWVQIFTPADDASWSKLHSLMVMTDDERLAGWRAHQEQQHAVDRPVGVPFGE